VPVTFRDSCAEGVWAPVAARVMASGTPTAGCPPDPGSWQPALGVAPRKPRRQSTGPVRLPCLENCTDRRVAAQGDARPAPLFTSSPGNAVSAARPWPSVEQPTVSPDRPCSTDARPLCVRTGLGTTDGGEKSHGRDRWERLRRPPVRLLPLNWHLRMRSARQQAAARHCCPAGRSRISLMARRRGRLRMKAMTSATSSAVTSALS